MSLYSIVKPDEISDVDTGLVKTFFSQVIDWATNKLLQIAVALVVIFLGIKLSKLIIKNIRKSMDKSEVDEGVKSFLTSLLKGLFYSIVYIIGASIVGFQVTSLVTILGTASLAIGLALQGSLANFAGGVLILIMKPFKVGDYIIENDKQCEGEVVSIDIFYTKLRTFDNKIIVIPNGNITSNSIVNLSSCQYRKVIIKVGVSYNSDIKKVKRVLEEVIKESKYGLDEKEYNIYVDSLDDSAIMMGVRFLVASNDYWNAKWEVTENIKLKFDENKIEIPYKQLEVNLISDK